MISAETPKRRNAESEEARIAPFRRFGVLAFRRFFRPGFTLIEVMLALAITAIIGAAIASMLASVSHATTDSGDLRRANVRQNVVAGRIAAALRSCKMVLALDTEAIVLWMGDSRLNGQPDLSEIRRIERNPATEELISYAAPAGLSVADDVTYLLTDNFATITAGLRGTANFPGRLWATGVIGWNITLDRPVAQHAKLATYDLAVGDDEAWTTATYAAAFRSR